MAHDSMYALQQSVLAALFTAEERRLGLVITALDRENRMLQPTAANYGFRHEGLLYIPPGTPKSSSPRPALHLSLVPQVEDFVKDKKRCESDRTAIGQILFRLLHQCNDDQERRDALPDFLVQFAPDNIKRLPRKFDHDTMLRKVLNLNRGVLNQYAQLVPRMELYAAGALIY